MKIKSVEAFWVHIPIPPSGSTPAISPAPVV